MTSAVSAGAVVLAVLVAWVIDHRWGEPAQRWHPVVWMGSYLHHAGLWVQRHTRQAPLPRDWRAFALGFTAWSVGATVVVAVALLCQWLLLQLPLWAGAVLAGLLLKPLLAWAMLKSEVRAVEAALGVSLDAGRARLRWLVSRDVAGLSATEVRESAIETLAENLNDSVVAPIFWFALCGLPGAALYRFANTADAMWGYPGLYRGGNWAWAGKWAARADDVLSWLPARLTALCMLLAAGTQGLRVVRQVPRVACQTPSPNSGWPMGTMALLLDVALRKPGVYVLHPAGRSAQVPDVDKAIFYASKSLFPLVFIGFVAMYFIATKGLFTPCIFSL